MDQAITAIGKASIAGVMVADDNIASGAIAAMRRAGISPLPPVTGMNAIPSAVELILTGEQAGSECLPFDSLGKAAAAIAVAMAKGEKPQTQGTIENATANLIPMIPRPTLSLSRSPTSGRADR